MNPETLKAMKERAEEARRLRPGKWAVHDSNSWRRIGTEMPYSDSDVICPVRQRNGHPDLCAERAILDHVAASDPANVSALIADYERLKNENERLKEQNNTQVKAGDWGRG